MTVRYEVRRIDWDAGTHTHYVGRVGEDVGSYGIYKTKEEAQLAADRFQTLYDAEYHSHRYTD